MIFVKKSQTDDLSLASTADACKNCAKRGKGLEFGINEALIL